MAAAAQRCFSPCKDERKVSCWFCKCQGGEKHHLCSRVREKALEREVETEKRLMDDRLKEQPDEPQCSLCLQLDLHLLWIQAALIYEAFRNTLSVLYKYKRCDPRLTRRKPRKILSTARVYLMSCCGATSSDRLSTTIITIPNEGLSFGGPPSRVLQNCGIYYKVGWSSRRPDTFFNSPSICIEMHIWLTNGFVQPNHPPRTSHL